MNKAETAAILAIIKTAYPNFYRDVKEVDAAINLWAMMFSSDPALIVTEAVKALMCSLKFPPTIADVKEKIHQIQEPDKMTELEAWSQVQRAIADSNYHAEERFAALPPLVQKIIGSHNVLREWAMMDTETVNSVIQSNFMRSFTAKQKQVDTYKALPDSTKEMIAGAKRFELTEGDGLG